MSQCAERVTLGPIQNPVRALLHGSAAFGFVVLTAFLADPARIASDLRPWLLLFSTTQVLLFATSATYHATAASSVWKPRLQRLDHTMIFVGIAGTATPIAWVALGDVERVATIAGVWAIAAAGGLQKMCSTDLPEKASIPVQFFQATLALPAMIAFGWSHPPEMTGTLAMGTTCYAVGALCFVTERPTLWPRFFSFHELFHVLTVIGSGLTTLLALELAARSFS